MIDQPLLFSTITDPGHAQDSTNPEESSPFQCQQSLDQTAEAFIPNIPDFYFDPEYAADISSTGPGANQSLSVRNRTYIFTVPPEQSSCEEYRVVGTEYCYRTTNSEIVNITVNRRIFEFLRLSQNGSQFVVDRAIQVHSVSNSSICAPIQFPIQGWFEQVCCNYTMFNSSDFFDIPSSGFTYGITARTYQPLILNDSSILLGGSVDQIQTNVGRDYPIPDGHTFMVSRKPLNASILYVRFILGE